MIFKKNQYAGFSKTYIFSGFRNICSIQDPRNYNVGKFILKGTKGSISDYEIKSNSNFKNLILNAIYVCRNRLLFEHRTTALFTIFLIILILT